MKRVLITGAGSFIGTSLEAYLSQWPDQFRVETLDMEQPSWQDHDFSGYDTVFHVAGVAHSDTGRLTAAERDRYFRVNRDLAVETAQTARAAGVKQFLFMSTAVVYGAGAPVGRNKIITKDTAPAPENLYGQSKLQAERGILDLEGPDFRVVILRPPLIYGPGCKGNYPVLRKLALAFPAFPRVENRRSMLYIGNFVEFLRLVIEREDRGIFHPQNREYVNTSDLARQIAAAHGKKLWLIPGCGWALKLLSHLTDLVDKAFGSLCYDQALSQYPREYRRFTLEESIRETEGTL